MASKMLFRANEILESTYVPFWGKDAFQYFQSDILSEENPFPCILGVEGFKKDLLRFSFVTTPYNYQDIRNAALALREYIDTFKTIGRYTSFVLFFKPEHKERSMEEYETMFWDTLTFLHQIDQKKWPQDIPKDPKDPLWEFCFHGEPIFVVCNTPAHSLRKSRKSRGFMITFQPRWVFEGMTGDSKIGKHVQKVVRDRLKTYDEVSAHPELGWYGQQENREWKQYFLRDDNNYTTGQCPFKLKRSEQHGRKKSLY
ncbi:YqcI/YcgG family protein [Bacillus megaterium]|uniref:YqcI/YcgG family protein n=1 Tax=Priestia megaterium TaxID=1404 RepID=UPI0012930DC0|nr:YqcI/YcgG family protein [Priestia megaterium]MQR85850.1 YqcI/YcgG family protein [Priestia megaterium]